MPVRVAVGLGLIALLALSGAIDWVRLLGLAGKWPLTVAALLMLFLTVVLSSWRLCMLLSGQGLHLPLGASIRLTLIGALFSNFLPGSSGGDLVRAYLAARANAGQRTEITTTLVIDRVIGLIALLTAPLLVALVGRSLVASSPSLRAMIWVSITAVAALIAILFIGAHPDGRLRRLAVRAAHRYRAGIHVERVFESIRAHRSHGRIVARACALSLVIQGLVIAAIQLILMANGSQSASWGAALLTPFGMLANALPLTPGGIGIGEAAFESLFLLAALTGGAEVLLSWRLLTTLIDLCGGVILVAGRTDARMLYRASAGAAQEASFVGADPRHDA